MQRSGIVSQRERFGIDFSVLIVKLLLKANGGRAEPESLIYLFCSLECLNCWGVGCGGVRHKVLFRAIWKHIFLIPGFENVSPGDGTDWLKETHCVSWELTKKI